MRETLIETGASVEAQKGELADLDSELESVGG